jgi:histidine ammonia-lyase
MTSALKLEQSVRLARTIIAIELLAATRALDLHKHGSTSPALQEAIRRLREHVPGWVKDCVLSVPIKKAEQFIAAGFLNDITVPVAAVA